jgi:hypothetical protein
MIISALKACTAFIWPSARNSFRNPSEHLSLLLCHNFRHLPFQLLTRRYFVGYSRSLIYKGIERLPKTKSLGSEQRAAIAKKAARARWKKKLARQNLGPSLLSAILSPLVPHGLRTTPS